MPGSIRSRITRSTGLARSRAMTVLPEDSRSTVCPAFCR